ELGGRARRLLPRDADPRVEARAGPGRLVDQGAAPVAVVAHRRLAEQERGAGLGGAQRVDQVLGGALSTLANPPLGVVRPALVDRLADQVDHRVDSLERARGRALGGRVPSAPGDRRDGGAGALGIAGQPDHRVTAREERLAEPGAEKPAGAGDEGPPATLLPAPGGQTG